MITELELKALTHNDIGTKTKPKRLRDGGGLVGQVGKDRAGRLVVSFSYQFRAFIPSKNKEGITSIAVGQWPKSTLKAIRKQRDIYRLEVNEGRNPVALKQAMALTGKAQAAEIKAQAKKRLIAIDEDSARMTVKDLFERWESLALCKRKDKGAEIRRMFDKDVISEMGAMAVEDVKKRHIVAMLDKVSERGVGRMVNLMLAQVRQMFRFALDREWIEADPTAMLKKENFGGRDVERDRVLSESEITALRNKLPLAKLTPQTECAIWLMLSTCCRVGELSKAKWSDINWEKKHWLIPASDTKNGREHLIALSPFAFEQILTLKLIQSSPTWIFPVTKQVGTTPKEHLHEKSFSKQIRDRQRLEPLEKRTKAVGVLLLSGGEWTPHDLRRTGATLMGELGVDGDVIERCLNHVEPNRMKRIYQRQRTEEAKTQAWALLGERLDMLCNADMSKVVTLNAA